MTRRTGSKQKKSIRKPVPSSKLAAVRQQVAEETLPDPPPVASSPWWRDPFTYLLAMLPGLVLVWNTSYIYTPAGYLDPWIYYGYMQHLRPMKVLFPATYYGSRLSWILPGALVRSILPSVPANYVLHLAVFFVAAFSVYWLLKRAFDARVAILSVICLTGNPYFWGAVGWDYVDGVGIAYYLLTMALLFKAAERRTRRHVFLVAAGASYAGLIYSNLAWGVFSPTFFGFYLWLLAGHHARKIWKAVFHFFLWFGVGSVAVSLILATANQLLEGNFWFYAPSLIFAGAMSRTPNPWKASNYQWLQVAYWLIFPVLGCLAALVTCVRSRWKTAFGNVGLFFALNLLFSTGVLIYMDARGNSLLEIKYYASYLIPSAILALGPLLFAPVSEYPKTRFRFTVAAAIASLLCIWALGAHPRIAEFAGAHIRMLVLAGLGLVAGAVILSRHSAAVFFGLAGFGLIGLGTRFSGDLNYSGGADAYHRIAAGMEAVEQMREGGPVRFWFDRTDRYGDEFNSLNSCYLWGPTAINFEFPSLAKDASLENGIMIVVPSSKTEVAPDVAAAFAGRQTVASAAGRTRLDSGGHGYWLHFFRTEPNPQNLLPAQVSFGQDDSSGTLDVAPEGSGETPLPSERWQMATNADGVGSKQDTSDGVLIETAKGRQDWSSIYSKLVVRKGGLYRFTLRYQLLGGDLTFGALKEDKSIWLMQAGRPYRVGRDLVKEFTMSIGDGQAIWLLTANNRDVDLPSRYVINELKTYRYKDASTVP